MQTFYQGFVVVQQFLHADARVPNDVSLPRPPDRQVARYLEERRDYPVVDVAEALGPLAQLELLYSAQRDAAIAGSEKIAVEAAVVEAPMPRVAK